MTRNFACEGKVCNPDFSMFKGKGTDPCASFINYCTATYDYHRKVWVVPKDWNVVNGRVICPRCYKKEKENEKK